MIITSNKTHSETYRNRLKQFSSGVEPPTETIGKESVQVTDLAPKSHAVPEFDVTKIESFWLRLTVMLTDWLRKHAA